MLTSAQIRARAVMAGPHRHVMLYGGSRSGKTYLICRQIVTRALKAPGSRHVIFRSRFNHVKRTIGQETMPRMLSIEYPQIRADWHKTDWVMSVGQGSEIWLAGLDDRKRTEKILGTEYSTIFLNECSQISWEGRAMAMTRLAQKVPQVIDGVPGADLPLKVYYDANPPDTGHWTYIVFEKGLHPDTRKPLPPEFVSFLINPEDNRENLAPEYFAELDALPPSQRRRFLLGQYADLTPDALFPATILDQYRVVDWDEVPAMQRVVVAVDPSGHGGEIESRSDDIGIIVAGLGIDGKGYVLADRTVKAGPEAWARVVNQAFSDYNADWVVAETNFGGAMVKSTIRTANPDIPFKAVVATRGKIVRAEPISSVAFQGRVCLVGRMPELEDELAGLTARGYVGVRSPNRADAMVFALSELLLGIIDSKRPKQPRMAPWKPADPITGY